MALKLTEHELENIKTCKYTTNPATKLDKVFDHWWEWLVNRVPKVSIGFKPNAVESAASWPLLIESVCSEYFPKSPHVPGYAHAYSGLCQLGLARPFMHQGPSCNHPVSARVQHILVSDDGRNRRKAGPTNRQLQLPWLNFGPQFRLIQPLLLHGNGNNMHSPWQQRVADPLGRPGAVATAFRD